MAPSVGLETVSGKGRLDHHPIATEDNFQENGRVPLGLVKFLCHRAGDSLEGQGWFLAFIRQDVFLLEEESSRVSRAIPLYRTP